MKFKVKIQATITKTLEVSGADEETAIRIAHERFSVLNDDTEENYDQETISVERA